jgi:hypothetical protein
MLHRVSPIAGGGFDSHGNAAVTLSSLQWRPAAQLALSHGSTKLGGALDRLMLASPKRPGSGTRGGRPQCLLAILTFDPD